ncbi:MAG: tetratricopeptide repeat protein [Desulfobacterales bacterium]
MAIKKKVSRKKLLKEPDEFLTHSARLFQFVVTHKYQMLGALGGVILLVLSFSAWSYHARQKTNESLSQLQKNWNRYEALRDQKDKGPVQAYQEVKADFEQLIAESGDTPGGRMARVVYADICYDAGEADKAIALYQGALDNFSQPFYRNQILNGLGYAYEAKHQPEKALEYFDKVATSSDPVLRAGALFNMGRLYAAQGQAEKSRQAYRKIVADSPQSLYAELAGERGGNGPSTSTETAK